MTFSDFAKILFPYCADGQTQSDFVLLLVDMIMEEPQAEYDKKNSEEDNYNPLSTLKPDTLGKIYSGKHTISKGNASIIKGHLDKERFAQYIDDKPIDAQMEIADTMSRSAPSFDVKETVNRVPSCFLKYWMIYLSQTAELRPSECTTQKGRQQTTVVARNPLCKMLME